DAGTIAGPLASGENRRRSFIPVLNHRSQPRLVVQGNVVDDIVGEDALAYLPRLPVGGAKGPRPTAEETSQTRQRSLRRIGQVLRLGPRHGLLCLDHEDGQSRTLAPCNLVQRDPLVLLKRRARADKDLVNRAVRRLRSAAPRSAIDA